MSRTRSIRICVILLILNLCFIWGNSLLPAEASQTLSDSLLEFLPDFSEGVSASPRESGVIRKIAHFTEFTALGLLLAWLSVLLQRKCRYLLPLGVAAACADECIQFFVPGRSPGILDVAIDAWGLLTGMLLLQIGHFYVRRKQPKQYGGKQ